MSAKESANFSGAQIEGVCQRAGLRAIRNRKSKDEKPVVLLSMFLDEIKALKTK